MLSKLARFLMLVACVPLLQPPGLCTCEAGDSGTVTSHQEADAAEATVPSRSTSHETAHCSHRHAAQDTDPSADAGPGRRHPTPARHDDHGPGCPAATAGVERLPWSELAPDPTSALPPTTCTGVRLAPATTRCRPVISPATHYPSALPFYLSHCSLVI